MGESSGELPEWLGPAFLAREAARQLAKDRLKHAQMSYLKSSWKGSEIKLSLVEPGDVVVIWSRSHK